MTHQVKEQFLRFRLSNLDLALIESRATVRGESAGQYVRRRIIDLLEREQAIADTENLRVAFADAGRVTPSHFVVTTSSGTHLYAACPEVA